ncbi:MAG: Gfo/Idh/MocA family oxidoreductase [Mariniblastus sp.]|nr:Gfo/Idh/MocA family oxidoreductase [Mariniblastus sp.]
MKKNVKTMTRRSLFQHVGAGSLAIGGVAWSGNWQDEEPSIPKLQQLELPRDAAGNVIPGFGDSTEQRESPPSSQEIAKEWQPVTDRKVKVGIAGYGLCQFGARFFYQNHPNVEVVAATDLDPQRCQGLAQAVGARKTYPSCEAMIQQDKEIEAVYVATDAPSHARLSILALQHGKHVVSAVPAVFGPKAVEEAEQLLEAVKSSGLKYMMNETSTFRPDLYAKRLQYQSGALGRIIYSEGEYWHDGVGVLGSYNPRNGKIDEFGWRRGLPPMWYPTHSTAYYVSVTGGGRLTDVSCVGMPSLYPIFQNGENQYRNPFGTQIGLFKTSEGGMSRMGVSWDMKNAHGEQGRCYGQKPHDDSLDGSRPPLPPGVAGGGHGGSHGHLTHQFIDSILFDRKPIVDVSEALNMTMAGIVAHESALLQGEWLPVPQYNL